MELDKADQKILGVLMENSRASLTKIARASRLSKETTGYRLNRMIESGLIKSFHVVLNTDLLGYQHYVVFMQLVRSTDEKEKEFLTFIKEINIHWVSLLAGKWNLMFDLYVRTGKELAETLQKILKAYGPFIGDYTVIAMERKWYYFKKLIKQTGALSWPTKISKKHPDIDDIDKVILKILGKDARTGYAELTKNIPLTANAIKKRILNLEKEGVILGYSVLVDYRKLGYEGYGLQLKLLNYQEGKLAEIFNFFENHPKIAMSYKYTAGQWDFDIRVIVKNSKEFRSFISELHNKFSEDLKISDFYLILEERIS